MSNAEMLDMCVRFLIENHALVTDEHLEMLDSLWHYKYETGAAFVEMSRQLAAEQPLPPSPPPEPELWACDWCGREWSSEDIACKLCGRDSAGVLPKTDEEIEEDYSCPNDDFCYASSIASDDYQEIVPEAHAQPQNQLVDPVTAPLPKKPHNPIYTNYRWPSPIAKVFVQQIRGNNPWQYRYKGSETWPFEFKRSWIAAGNTELKLTHDNCMRYLAYKMGKLTPEQLMEKTPREVHAKLIGEYTGVPGYYTPRRWY